MAYFDNNSTTKPGAEVREALRPRPREKVGETRPLLAGRELPFGSRLIGRGESIARLLEVDKESVTFTSGSTEANNAVFAHAARCFEPSARALVSSIEHPSVLAPADHWFSKRVQTFPVEPTGVIDLERISALLDGDSEVRLVSLMAANNETGVLQPWRELADLCRERGIHFHCDATQWIGKLSSSGLSACSSFSASAHKLGGPKGVGILVSDLARPFVLGGSQESDRRSGTENYPAVKAMSVAFELMNARLLSSPTGHAGGMPLRKSCLPVFQACKF